MTYVEDEPVDQSLLLRRMGRRQQRGRLNHILYTQAAGRGRDSGAWALRYDGKGAGQAPRHHGPAAGQALKGAVYASIISCHSKEMVAWAVSR